MFQPKLDEIRKADRRLRTYVRRTPVLPSSFSNEVFFKAESLQLTGSFKIRTALHQILRLGEGARRHGIVASSSGNFAQGVAMAGKLLSLDVSVVMMESSNPFKVELTRQLGAKVVFCEDRFEARQETVARIREAEGRVEVHPYDRPDGILGNATLALEALEQFPQVRHLVVPISGGGLIAGVACAVKLLKPEVQLWGVQPLLSNATHLSFRAQRPCSIGESRTIADGLRVTKPGNTTLPIILSLVDEVVVVEEESIREAVRLLLWNEHLVVEPSGAVTLAAMLEKPVPANQTLLVLSGGNIDPGLLREIVAKEPL